MDKINAKKFDRYVYEKRAIGLSDKQIANSLGMSLKHFYKITQGTKEESVIETKIEKKPKPIESKPVKVEEPIIEPIVPEVKEEPNETT